MSDAAASPNLESAGVRHLLEPEQAPALTAVGEGIDAVVLPDGSGRSWSELAQYKAGSVIGANKVTGDRSANSNAVQGMTRRGFIAGAVAAGGFAAWSPLTRVVASAQESPPGIELYRFVYENWARAIKVSDLWACAPTSPEQVVTLVNWAHARGWKVRASGFMHNWSPFTVTGQAEVGRLVLADTRPHLASMAMDDGWDVPAVRVGSGARLDTLMAFLEERGYGWTATTAPGDVSVGGVLAVGAHGSAIPATGETRLPGATYGSISNLVLELTAVVWHGNKYVLRTFRRDDKKIAALLVHLGRAFVTEVVLQVSPNVNLRCESDMSVPASELFADPSVAGDRSFAAYLDRSGRVETIWFPFTDAPWLKVWTVTPDKPVSSRATSEPYNYPFSDNVPPEIAALADDMVTSNPSSTPAFGQMMYAVSAAGLAATQSADLWGPSKNTLFYIKPSTLRVTANGYAVLCRRADIQQVIADFCAKYLELAAEYRTREEYPMNMPVEIRVTGLERPEDVGVAGAVAPALSANTPRADHPEWDVAVWFNVLSFPGTPASERCYREMETWLVDHYGDAIRPEWSKGWGYGDAPWSDTTVASMNHPELAAAAKALDKLDPHRVFTNPFLERLLPRHT